MNNVLRRLRLTGLLTCSLAFLSGCASKPVGIEGDHLRTCPNTPNCVCSDSDSSAHQIAPFVLNMDPELAWQHLNKLVLQKPRMQVVTQTADYLHLEARSRIFRFVDDVEFHLRPTEGIIAVRSAARLGRSDFDVNRKRLEALRADLRREGVLR